MRRLTITPDEMSAATIVGMLEANGIPATHRITDLATASMFGSAPGSAARGAGGMREVLVPETALDLARELIETEGSPVVPRSHPTVSFNDSGRMPVLVTNVSTGLDVGEIDACDLTLLRSMLVAGNEDDSGYYVNDDTIEMLRQSGASDRLLAAICRVLDNGEGDISWRPRRG